MNPRFYHKIPADFLSGKAVLILIVILCSAFSFLLGYYAGKSSARERPALSSKNPPAEGEGFRAADVETEAPAGETGSDAATALPAPVTAPAERPGSNEGKEPEKKAAERAGSDTKRVRTREAGDYYYTIQVGAFRGRKQAAGLRDRLRKKGYSVKVVEAGRNRTLYRVWVGRFGSRKAAETAAIKLTRAEKLKTLVVRTDR